MAEQEEHREAQFQPEQLRPEALGEPEAQEELPMEEDLLAAF